MDNNELSAIEKLLDEENDDNIILYDADDNPVEFEQIAIIPLDGKLYAMLKPVVLLEGMSDDEALVFVLEEDEGEEMMIVCDDDDVIDAVFEIYHKLWDEEDAE